MTTAVSGTRYRSESGQWKLQIEQYLVTGKVLLFGSNNSQIATLVKVDTKTVSMRSSSRCTNYPKRSASRYPGIEAKN